MKNLLLGLLLVACFPLTLSAQEDGPILFLVAETQIEEGQSDAYFELMRNYISKAEQVDGFRLPHFNYLTDQNSALHVDMVADLNAVQALREQSAREREHIGAEMQPMMGKYMDLVHNTTEYIVEFHPELAYFPSGEDAIPEGEEQYYRWLFLDFDFGDYSTVMELAKEARDLQIELKSTTTTRIYTNYFGGPAGQIIVQHGARNEEDLERLMQVDEERMSQSEAYKAWDERAKAVTSVNRIVHGAFLPEFSAPPE